MKHGFNLTLHLKNTTLLSRHQFLRMESFSFSMRRCSSGPKFILLLSGWKEKNKFSFIVAAGKKKKCQKCVHLWGHQIHNRVTSKPASRSANIIHLVSVMPHSSSVSTERTSETDKTPAVLDRVVAFQNKFLQEQGQRNTAFCIFLKLSPTT